MQEDIVFESTSTLDADEFEEWVDRWGRPDDLMHYELLNGRIVMTPPPGYPHGEVGANIHRFLGPFVHAQRVGKVFLAGQGFAFPSGDVVEPDVAFVSRERWDRGPPAVFGKLLRVVPDVIFEILSKRTTSYDRGEKKAIYAANGVREYWLIDPRAREVVVFNLKGKRYARERVFDERTTATSFVLEGLEMPVAELIPESP